MATRHTRGGDSGGGSSYSPPTLALVDRHEGKAQLEAAAAATTAAAAATAFTSTVSTTSSSKEPMAVAASTQIRTGSTGGTGGGSGGGGSGGVNVVCAAELWDDLFRQVRVWTRLGHTPAQIQHAVDTRWAALLSK